jgi:type IV secretory pathway TrbF-like protein
MKRPARTDLQERVQYTKYHEHDGMLRAYANRAMVVAMLFAVIAMSSLEFAIYVRIQPPTVVRVDESGNATTVGSPSATDSVAAPSLVFAQAAAETAPELEAKAAVRRFLDNHRRRR